MSRLGNVLVALSADLWTCELTEGTPMLFGRLACLGPDLEVLWGNFAKPPPAATCKLLLVHLLVAISPSWWGTKCSPCCVSSGCLLGLSLVFMELWWKAELGTENVLVLCTGLCPENVAASALELDLSFFLLLLVLMLELKKKNVLILTKLLIFYRTSVSLARWRKSISFPRANLLALC